MPAPGLIPARSAGAVVAKRLRSPASSTSSAPWTRASARSAFATVAASAIIPPKPHHRVVIVGGGTAGVTTAAQLMRTKQFTKGDIAILDPAKLHHYQPGWTLVGSGLKPLSDMSRPLESVIPPGVTHYPLQVTHFDPANNQLRTKDGVDVSYEYLVVAPGLEVDLAAVGGLPDALRDPASGVSSIYSHRTVEQVWRNIRALRKGTAVFTQPAGAIKCAGAPQKILWMALSQWERDGARKDILPVFATGAGAMFAVPKYAKALEKLRVQRGVEGLFQHNLVGVDVRNKIAKFKNLADGGKEVQREFDFLHVVPPQKPFNWVAKSPLADSAGWVDVDKTTTQHTRYPNVFSLGDASSLPNSKTAAAISSQAPVLVDNLLACLRRREEGQTQTQTAQTAQAALTAGAPSPLPAGYDGYASCPLLTGHGELMLCEFRYGGVPQETFASVPGIGSQDVPRRAFWHLKKDFFPRVYWASFLRGTWFGPRGWLRPDTARKDLA